MFRVRLTAAVVLLAGCSDRGPPEPVADRPPEPPPPGLPPAESEPVVGTATLDSLPLTDPALLVRLRRADAIARRLAGDGLTDARYSTWTVPGRTEHFRLSWNGRLADGKTGPLELSSHSPGQDVTVEGHRAFRVLNQSAGEGLVVRASRTPPGAGWGAYVQFWEQAAARPAGEWAILAMHFYYPGHRPAVVPPYSALQVPSPRIGLVKHFGKFHYEVSVPPRGKEPAGVGWGGGRTAEVMGETRKYFASAESFRGMTLADLDRLERAAREGILGGDSIREYPPEKLVRTDTGRSVVTGGLRSTPEVPTHELTPDQRAGVLNEVLDLIERRRALVQTHFKEMHAAARAAFPLDEYLSEDPPRRAPTGTNPTEDE